MKQPRSSRPPGKAPVTKANASKKASPPKKPSKKAKAVLPPPPLILFEDDPLPEVQPAPVEVAEISVAASTPIESLPEPAPSIPTEKPAPQNLAPEAGPELPRPPEPPRTPPLSLAYLELMLRDPAWLYAAWDFNRSPDVAHAAWRLRLWCEGEALPRSEFHLTDTDRSRFVAADAGPAGCTAEVGCWLPDGSWRHFGWSNRVSLPRIAPAPTVSVTEIEQPHFQPPVHREEPSPTTSTPTPANATRSELEPSPIAAGLKTEAAPSTWCPPPQPSHSPAEIRERIHQILGFKEEARPGTASSLDLATQANQIQESPTDAMGTAPNPTPSNVSSGELSHAGASQESSRGFWLKVNAELIIFGSTEPGSQLTVAGQPVRLKPDGSFRLQFALPDGWHALPVQATSPDGIESRTVNLDFARETVSWGEVGVHPKNPALMPPGPEAIRAASA